jgi:phage tail sheath protein FI
MPEYLSPGVYIEEIPGIKPIAGVGTSTAAFVGIAEKGPINSPQLITNFSQFLDTFGGFSPKAHLAYAVRHFFTERGTRCYVIRAFKLSASPSATNPKPDVAAVTLRVTESPPGNIVMHVFAANEGAWGNNIFVKAEEAGFNPADPANTARRFRLRVLLKERGAPEPTLVETFDQLSMDEFDGPTDFPNPDHVERRINGVSKYITVRDVTTNRAEIDPPFFSSTPMPLTGGSDGATPGGTSNNLQPVDLIGTEATDTASATGLRAFDIVDDINIVAIPELVNPAFVVGDARDATIAGFTYCENRKDCFFVADAPSGLSPQAVLAYKRGQSPFSGNAFNSKYAALYYPWIYAVDLLTGKRRLFPPSGAVAGSYSAADIRIGVHKAPAGTEDGFLNSAADIERVITQGEQDTLNPEGVNVIRKFPDAGILIWGARTVSADPEWTYVNVRRLFLFLEESILKGTQWVVFEPNDPVLWKRITRNVSAFLRNQWREGKLVGEKPEQAFFVKCDAETNPPESVDLGRVITLIGVAPSKPAEFVIFRISQSPTGASATE